MIRWLLASLALSAFFWLLGVAALALWPVRPVSNLAELVLFPSTVVVSLFVPAIEHHQTERFYMLRSLLAGFGYSSCGVILSYGRRWLTVLRQQPVETGRRKLLTQALLATALGTALYSVLLEPFWLRVRRYEVALKGLPPELDGFKLGHLSDSHHGPLISLGHIRRAIGLLNAEKPDLILLTGDYVHQTPAAIPQGIAVLTGCQARLGMLAVLGNHDHWEGAEACRAEFGRHGLRLLDNDRLFLSTQGLSETPVPGCVAICGVGDLWEDVVEPEKALREVPEECLRVLMSHNPDVAELIPAEHRFDLQLSGHTHGGQVSFPGVGPVVVPSRFGARYAGGLVQGPRWPVVISRGVGMAVIPVRFRVPPEVGVITLRRA